MIDRFKIGVVLLLLVFSLHCMGQITFDTGYFVDNSGKKTICLIRNVDGMLTPTKIDYKMPGWDEIKQLTMNDIQEFGIINYSTYKRFVVDIDRSSELVKKLSGTRSAEFEKDTIFLKALVEGSASVYEYGEIGLQRYFYIVDDQPIKQLVYKLYKSKYNKVGVNESYKQQLKVDLECEDIKLKKIEKLKYGRRDFIKLFSKYNRCRGTDYRVWDKREERDLLNVMVSVGPSISSLSTRNELSLSRSVEVEDKVTLVIGATAEFISYFNRNKWSLVLQPSFHYFSFEKTINLDNIAGQPVVVNGDYKTIDWALGIRHSLYFEDESRLFLNASYVPTFNFNSEIQYTRIDGLPTKTLEVNAGSSWAFGIGYNRNRAFVELSYRTPRELLVNYVFWKSTYKSLTLVLSYNIL